MRFRLTAFGMLVGMAGLYGQWEPTRIVIPEITVRYTCDKTGRYWVSYGKDSSSRHYCWDGKHYSKAEGGVPAFILEHWERKERESAQLRREMDQRTAELHAAVAADRARLDADRRARGLPTHDEIRQNPELARTMRSSAAPGTSTATLERSTRPKAEPIESASFDELRAGMERTVVVARLGEPHGQIGNLGSEGDEESLTYLVAGGGQVSIRLKGGRVVALKLPPR